MGWISQLLMGDRFYIPQPQPILSRNTFYSTALLFT